jgi:RNA polymerase sigma-70 factor (ECF subfamily)
MKALEYHPKEVNDMEDQRIIELYFARNELAIKETDNKYGKLCHRIAYNILRNDEDAEECVNDTYIGAWNAIPPTIPHNLTAFLCRITRNLSLKRLEAMTRQKRAQMTLVSLDELAEILPDESIAYGVSDEELGKAISDFLRMEKESVRNVFIRKYYFLDSVSEIAKRYGFTESKVKNMLYQTRNKLKEYLIKEGFEI